MIFVDRTRVAVPPLLSSPRVLNEQKRLLELLESATDEHLAQLRVTLDSSIWKQLVPSLQQLFNGKCAYCESDIKATQTGDVEHYRPKQSSAPNEGPLQHLYYAWLAYDWDNLLILCADCNRRRAVGNGKLVGKGDGFPLKGKRARFLAGVAECRNTEQPLLLDPCFDQPSQHLTCEATGLLRGRSDRGEATIEILGLNLREALVAARRRAWDEVTLAVALSEKEFAANSRRDSTAETLRRALSDEQPYHLARRCALTSRASFLRESGILSAEALRSLGADPEGPQPEPVEPSDSARAAIATGTVRPGKYAGKKLLPPFAFHRVRRVEIRNFKAIEEIDIDVPEGPKGESDIPGALTLLGENATGKSSILEAVALAILGTDQSRNLKLDGKNYLRREVRGGSNAAAPRGWRRPPP